MEIIKRRKWTRRLNFYHFVVEAGFKTGRGLLLQAEDFSLFFLQDLNHRISKMCHENFVVLQLFSVWSSSSLNHQVPSLQAWRISASCHVLLWMHSFSWAEGDNIAKCQAVTLFRDFCWDRHVKTQIHNLAESLSLPLKLQTTHIFCSTFQSYCDTARHLDFPPDYI